MKKLLLLFVSVLLFGFNATKQSIDDFEKVTLSYTNFDITFFNYDIYPASYEGKVDPTKVKQINKDEKSPVFEIRNSDTVLFGENVFNSLSEKLIEITPKNKKDRFKISYAFTEYIHELFRRKLINNKNFDWKEWYKSTVHWEGETDYTEVKDSLDYFFKIPEINHEAYEILRERKLNLRDTLVVEPGETEVHATLVYKEKPCTYTLQEVLVRVDRLRNDEIIETKYIKIIISYGC